MSQKNLLTDDSHRAKKLLILYAQRDILREVVNKPNKPGTKRIDVERKIKELNDLITRV